MGFDFQNPKRKRKNFKELLNSQMAALVVLNSDLSKLTKTAIKKEIRKKLSTIEEYKIQIEIAIDK